jgi:hypothetical protein
MDNQHKQIKGYRDLTAEEIGKMNAAKGLAEQVGAFIETLEGEPTLDKRWLAIARTDLQKGFMALVRSIAQPTSF